MLNKEHLTKQGLATIQIIKSNMNRKRIKTPYFFGPSK